MTYPTLDALAADAVAEGIFGGLDESELAKLCSAGDGADYPHEHIDAAASASEIAWVAEKATREESGETADIYYLEAFMASRIHRDLSVLHLDMRQDFGFWRYLALFPYRWYLVLREADEDGVFKPQDYGGTSEKKDDPKTRINASPAYQLILRTYLWGKIAFDEGKSPDEYDRATLVNRTGGAVTDIWHSHLVRIQLGQLGRMPHAFLDSVCAEPQANGVDEGRAVEKRLTRMKHTVLYDVLDLADARTLVDSQKAIVLGLPPG